MQWQQQDYLITDNPDDLDLDTIHGFLRQTYWAKGIPRALVEKALANSLCFGVYRHGRQVGFARAITDRATFAYLGDVFILPDHRGRGLAKRLVACILEHPHLQGLRRILLVTSDAHGLYRGCGFSALKEPGKFMEIGRPNPYQADHADR
ncbi:GNAT family N-acetyltransferase [Desulfoprunum benzoelyticum]|uniref:GNAT superfamily N-acetyltransferase n=1 Tax=Desulfoprunum benzoelyticum TaxID=1506996 RepID=A0A840UQG9_9BACT|nr:GNAT family N-acetyltransferase [Desulfoprunum benzoelyticum]MBB5348467.1 GNAT superfamily N-acetyltransferase [Desulfoprunum benzoelyticum]MBM9530198.1 GNAT family N-acetyltransferase [Desulfoprunum benzoelyticum]